MSTVAPRLSHLDPFTRGLRLHWRLLACLGAGIAVYFALPHSLPVPTRLLGAWDAALVLYVALSAAMLARADVRTLRQRAIEEDEGAAAITVLAVLAALASLGAIFAELGTAKSGTRILAPHVALAVVTVALSWFFIHAIFAQHYANEYYGGADGCAGGLQFPGDGTPGPWDFLYFSLVIGMTSQVSDVAVTRTVLRQTVAAHGVLSFVFNTTIIALTVNIASSII